VAKLNRSAGIYRKGSGSLSTKCAYTASGAAYGQKTNSIASECDPEVQQDTVEDPIGVCRGLQRFDLLRPQGNQPLLPPMPRQATGLKIWDLCSLKVAGTLNLQPGLYIIYGWRPYLARTSQADRHRGHDLPDEQSDRSDRLRANRRQHAGYRI
jgi:hypothetical protein